MFWEGRKFFSRWNSNCASLDNLNQMGCFATGKLAGGDPAACLLNDASGVDAAISNQPRQCCIHTHKQSATQTRTWHYMTSRSSKTVMKGTRMWTGEHKRRCARRTKPTLTDRWGSVHLQPLSESTGQNLTAHQGEAWQTRVPDDVPC